ncbi:GATOR2 complex protein WDR24-like isoform X2 [Littorina saxatilis]|uniref:GATOR2 complex protein WDR24 n=1 Tax=Littorina saxatilis TaxID=31220 RepID=A0AAN9GIG2_9CAEN
MQAAMHNMTKVVQDKVSPTHNLPMSINCDGPVNAMDMNKDMSKVVVAGRQVFKIIEVEDDMFVETSNLRVGKPKNINLNYSAADVAWNHNDENMLASAATNGAVVIWNLSKQVKSKQEFVFMEHKRSVNRVVFHNSEAYQLLSGSQDGTMKLHDLRRKQVTLTFMGRSSESVRDIQFCPANLGYFSFAAAYENGIVQIWDMRRPDRCEKHFTAHNEPVFALDWHPEDKHWLATAGRDKMIKVWDINKQPAQLLYVVQTIASVGRIKWRPQRRYHIANCSLLLDHNVNVWDVRRPYIPFACFEQHKDVATCVLWKDPHILLSTGKDYMLHQHIFQSAKRPGDFVIPSGVDISIHGDVCLAYKERTAAVKGKEAGKISMFGRKTSQSRSELFFTQANSSLAVFQQIAEPNTEDEFAAQQMSPTQLASEDVSMTSFLELAKKYRLKGLTTEELCRHNSAAAAAVDKYQVAQTWQIMGNIFCTKTSSTKSTSLQVPRINVTPNAPMDRQDVEKGKAVSSPDNEVEVVRSDNDKEKNGEISTGTDSDSDGESSEFEKNQLADIASGLGHNGDFFFGDGDNETLSYPLGITVQGGEDWTQLPSEAFQPRHEITGPAAPPDRLDHDSLMVAAVESDAVAVMTPIEESEPSEQYLNLNIDCSAFHAGTVLDYTSTAVDIICCFAEQGDIQSAVSMLIVLGDHVRSHIDGESQENWFMSYIDLLSRFRLWTIASEVIALSHLPQVMQLNQSSTSIHTACPHCMRTMERSGWLCDRCKSVVNMCSICHCPVKGLAVWCQGCCHGGHIQHIQDWLVGNILCPEGCGHMCEYT